MRRTCFVSALAVLAACATDDLDSYPDDELAETPATALPTGFPRLGGMLIGNPKAYEDPAVQAKIARLDVAVLGIYEGWHHAGKTPAQAVAEIKARNPNLVLANYTIMTEASRSRVNRITTKLGSEKGPNGIGDWWARDAAGNHVAWTDIYGQWDTNLTMFTRPDANGDRFPQWLARSDHAALLAGVGYGAWFCDNNFGRPRVTADWNRDGANDGPTAAASWYRAGQRAYYDTARSVAPALQLWANVDNDLSAPEFKNVLDGGFLEALAGKSWSIESNAGWRAALDRYRAVRANLRGPKVVLVGSLAADYQSARYMFGTTLLDDGYFAVNDGSNPDYYGTFPWYDEFDNAGRGGTKWLGLAVDAPPTAPYQDGVWRRRFTGGMVLVNPRGNGARTVTIEAGYRRIAGTQVPSINNGQPATTITLADRDAILLVKDGPATVFPATADTYVRNGGYASQSFGTAAELTVKSDAAGYLRRAYVRFDVGAFSGTRVSSAKLRVTVAGAGTEATRTIKAYGVGSDTWSETATTWNNAPASGTALGAAAIANVPGRTYELDVTAFVNASMNDKRVSFVLVNDGAHSSQNQVTFKSRETGGGPQLVLTP